MESCGSGFNDILRFVMMCEYVVWVARSDRIEAARYMKMLRYYSVSCFLKTTSSFTNDAAFPNFLCFLDDRHDGFVALGILRLLPKWMSFLVTDKVNR
jgi:hypothetical protein